MEPQEKPTLAIYTEPINNLTFVKSSQMSQDIYQSEYVTFKKSIHSIVIATTASTAYNVASRACDGGIADERGTRLLIEPYFFLFLM